jgi:hypothetical protein
MLNVLCVWAQTNFNCGNLSRTPGNYRKPFNIVQTRGGINTKPLYGYEHNGLQPYD